VLGIPHEDFEKRFDKVKEDANAKNDVDLGVDDLKQLCDEYKQVYVEQGKEFHGSLRTAVRLRQGRLRIVDDTSRREVSRN
jgi:hypothetical protein